MQKENDPSGLFKRIFVSAPHTEFSNLDKSKTINHHTKIKVSLILLVIVNDINAGKSDVVHKLDDESFEFIRKHAIEHSRNAPCIQRL